MEAPRKYAELKGDVTTLLEDTGRFLGRLVEAPKTDGGHQLLLDTKLSDFFAKYIDLKRRKEGGLSCAVLALTKSGTFSFSKLESEVAVERKCRYWRSFSWLATPILNLQNLGFVSSNERPPRDSSKY